MQFAMRPGGILLFIACAALAAQSDEVRVSAHAYTPPQLHLAAETNLVQLEVVVRDQRGHAVAGMKADDFEILDEGKPRAIAAFSSETRGSGGGDATHSNLPTPPQPRSILLYFDDLHVTTPELQHMQTAAAGFVQGALSPSVRAALYTASQGLLVDFTSDATALTLAIQKLRPHQHLSENGMQPCPRITPYTAYMIDHLNDNSALTAAVREFESCGGADSTLRSNAAVTRNITKSSDPHAVSVTSVQAQASATMQQVRADSLAEFDALQNGLAILAKAPGTRFFVIASDGFISGMLNNETDAAVNLAVRAGIVINALDAKGTWANVSERPFGQESQTTTGVPTQTFAFEDTNVASRNDAINSVMQEFAAGTGGLFFHNSNDLADGFSQLAAAPSTAYLIAFHPDTEGQAGKYHKLKVRLKANGGNYVQARPGYVTPASSSTAAATAAQPRPIDVELAADSALTAIPAQLTARAGKTDKGDTLVSALIHVDLTPLKFAQRDDRHVQKLMFIGELLDANGKIVAAKEGAMDLALKDDTLARLTASGVNAGLSFPAAPGPYKVRVVVQDAEGKLASLNQAVDVPR